MTSYPAQYGFEYFEVPDYDLEPMDNDRYRFTINEGSYANEWIEIYDLSFDKEPEEDGEAKLLFSFESSLGEDNTTLNDLAEKLIKEVIIRSMEFALKDVPSEEQE